MTSQIAFTVVSSIIYNVKISKVRVKSDNSLFQPHRNSKPHIRVNYSWMKYCTIDLRNILSVSRSKIWFSVLRICNERQDLTTKVNKALHNFICASVVRLPEGCRMPFCWTASRPQASWLSVNIWQPTTHGRPEVCVNVAQILEPWSNITNAEMPDDLLHGRWILWFTSYTVKKCFLKTIVLSV